MATRRKVARLLLPLLLLLIVGGLMGADRVMRPVIHINGLADGAWLSAHELQTLVVVVYADQTGLGQVSVTVDDKPIRGRTDGNTHIVNLPPTLSDAHHVLRVTVPGLLGPLRQSRGFTVRRTAPTLEVNQAKATSMRAPLAITGTADPSARISAPGATVTRKGDKFTLQFATPPATGAVTIHAEDKAGNRTDTNVQVTYVYPGTRAVWLSNQSFATNVAMTSVLSLAKSKKIDSVVLDVKPENGQLSYGSKVPFAQQITALPNKPVYDPAQTLTQLHNAGLRVIGRIYCYADPQVATDATRNHHLERLVTTAGGTAPYTDGAALVSGNYVNLANPDVTGYLTALGVEAAQLGFDDVLYDDCRKPDATLDKMTYQGIKPGATIEQTIADFLAAARTAIHAQHAWVGATLDRQAVTSASTVGQNIPALTNPANYSADYLVPKLYPSQFKAGEFGIDEPKTKPYDAVKNATGSMVTYAGADFPIVPALQDFTPGGGTNPFGTTTYGSTQLTQQFHALRDLHFRWFILWGPTTGKYDTTAIPAM